MIQEFLTSVILSTALTKEAVGSLEKLLKKTVFEFNNCPTRCDLFSLLCIEGGKEADGV